MNDMVSSKEQKIERFVMLQFEQTLRIRCLRYDLGFYSPRGERTKVFIYTPIDYVLSTSKTFTSAWRWHSRILGCLLLHPETLQKNCATREAVLFGSATDIRQSDVSVDLGHTTGEQCLCRILVVTLEKHQEKFYDALFDRGAFAYQNDLQCFQ